MKKLILLLVAIFMAVPALCQDEEKLPPKGKEEKRNMIVKEWNTDAKTKTRWLDHQTTYDDLGRKIEEIEYASHGQKNRVTYEYGEDDKVSMEVEYNELNKPVRIRKYEYYSNGKKKKQYNYAPNGKLVSVKVFEYIVSE